MASMAMLNNQRVFSDDPSFFADRIPKKRRKQQRLSKRLDTFGVPSRPGTMENMAVPDLFLW
jgi:hypothetical protein